MLRFILEVHVITEKMVYSDSHSRGPRAERIFSTRVNQNLIKLLSASPETGTTRKGLGKFGTNEIYKLI